MDEIIDEGWREALEKTTGNQITYVFRNKKDFVNNRIHARHGFIWKFLMHESVVTDRTEMIDEFCPGIEVTHIPDTEKSRTQYLELLKDALAENPNIGRYYKYLTDTYLSEKKFKEAEKYFLKVLDIPDFPIEDAAHVYKTLSEIIPEKTGEYLLLCLKTARHRREPYYYIAKWYEKHERWEECLTWCNEALKIEKTVYDIFYDKDAWGISMQTLYENALANNYNEEKD
jgi:tetratricopeptide (TPR) repeat protein